MSDKRCVKRKNQEICHKYFFIIIFYERVTFDTFSLEYTGGAINQGDWKGMKATFSVQERLVDISKAQLPKTLWFL